MDDVGSTVERVVELPGQGRTVVWDCPGPLGAPTLVLVHGATMTAELNWSVVFPVLGQHFRVLAFDQRGHGRGLGCAGGYRLEQCADDVAGLAAVLGIEQLIVVGYSMGGLIAQLCWRRHRQLTAGLVLCATARSMAGLLWARWVTLMMPALMMPAVVAEAGLMPWMAGLRADLIGTHLFGQDCDRDDRAWALGQVRRTSLLTAASAVYATYGFSSHDWIGGVDVPTAVIITRRDRRVSAARQWRLAAAVPGPLRGRGARRVPEDLFRQRYHRSGWPHRWPCSLLNTPPDGCVRIHPAIPGQRAKLFPRNGGQNNGALRGTEGSPGRVTPQWSLLLFWGRC